MNIKSIKITNEIIKLAIEKSKRFELKNGKQMLLTASPNIFVGKLNNQLLLIPYNDKVKITNYTNETSNGKKVYVINNQEV